MLCPIFPNVVPNIPKCCAQASDRWDRCIKKEPNVADSKTGELAVKERSPNGLDDRQAGRKAASGELTAFNPPCWS